MGVYDTFQSADYEIEDPAVVDVYATFTVSGRRRVSGAGSTGGSDGSGGLGGFTDSDILTYLRARPNSDLGLTPGDLYWNGDFLCRKSST